MPASLTLDRRRRQLPCPRRMRTRKRRFLPKPPMMSQWTKPTTSTRPPKRQSYSRYISDRAMFSRMSFPALGNESQVPNPLQGSSTRACW